MTNTEPTTILPLGGLGEFGMNCMLYRHGETRFLVDCGVMFPEPEHAGVDFLVPQFDPLADWPIDALVLTHAHEDHAGGVPFLLHWRRENHQLDRLPVYATRFTAELVRRRLEEHDVLDMVEIRLVKPGDVVDIGPVEVEMIGVNHSIPGAVALALHTPTGVILHSGDWRVDHEPVNEPFIDLPRLAELGREGVLLLLADSTNIEAEGNSASESAVGRELEDVFDLAPGRVFVTQFSSNIWRIQSVLHAAQATGRKVALLGRSLLRNVGVARETGDLLLSDPDVLLDISEMGSVPHDEQVLIIGGSQGEPFSSLARMAFGDHNQISVNKGDWLVYSSRKIPGNEKRIGRVIDELHRQGVEVLMPGKRQLHTTGHAYREELKLLFSLLAPRHFIPMHGNYRLLHQHAALAREMGVENVLTLSDGDILELHPDDPTVVDHLDLAPQCVAGSSIGLVDSEVLRQRRQLAFAGFLTVHTLLGPDDTCREIVLHTYGVTAEPELLVEPAKGLVRESVEMTRGESDEAIAETIRIALRRFLRRETDRKPFVISTVTRLEQ